jgi:hypothetical protein
MNTRISELKKVPRQNDHDINNTRAFSDQMLSPQEKPIVLNSNDIQVKRSTKEKISVTSTKKIDMKEGS